MLVDTGNPGPRDGDRIVAMLADAGVKQLDYLIVTHYHVDHVGGLQELVYTAGIEHNPAGVFIANVDDAAAIAAVLTAPPPAPGGGGGGGTAAASHTPAYYIKVSAQSDGTFTVTNMRNQFSKTYRT